MLYFSTVALDTLSSDSSLDTSVLRKKRCAAFVELPDPAAIQVDLSGAAANAFIILKKRVFKRGSRNIASTNSISQLCNLLSYGSPFFLLYSMETIEYSHKFMGQVKSKLRGSSLSLIDL